MTTITPSPWTLEIGIQTCFHKGNRVSISKEYPPNKENGWEGCSETIAEVWPTNPPNADGDIADGRLIAAAPDLLEACQWLIESWEESPDDQARTIIAIASERARDAVAKAVGA